MPTEAMDELRRAEGRMLVVARTIAILVCEGTVPTPELMRDFRKADRAYRDALESAVVALT